MSSRVPGQVLLVIRHGNAGKLAAAQHVALGIAHPPPQPSATCPPAEHAPNPHATPHAHPIAAVYSGAAATAGAVGAARSGYAWAIKGGGGGSAAAGGVGMAAALDDELGMKAAERERALAERRQDRARQKDAAEEWLGPKPAGGRWVMRVRLVDGLLLFSVCAAGLCCRCYRYGGWWAGEAGGLWPAGAGRSWLWRRPARAGLLCCTAQWAARVLLSRSFLRSTPLVQWRHCA